MATVSIICTVLNEGPAIQKLLDSLSRQTRPADEIIFVDGGSTDDTVLFCRHLPQKINCRCG
ncbi:MAG: glycosyltransferase [Anaerolineales bacterium]|nr:glycosyltransferase [Anaerolineales bacterium]